MTKDQFLPFFIAEIVHLCTPYFLANSSPVPRGGSGFSAKNSLISRTCASVSTELGQVSPRKRVPWAILCCVPFVLDVGGIAVQRWFVIEQNANPVALFHTAAFRWP